VHVAEQSLHTSDPGIALLPRNNCLSLIVLLIALQEIGHQVLHSSCATSAAKLASAAAAVGKLRANELAEGVADLAVSPAEAPDALLSLLAALQRVRVLVTAGAEELSRDKQVAKACQVKLDSSHICSKLCLAYAVNVVLQMQ
jgi:hypothetical protein